jgi:hypothetical protein
LEFPGIGTGEVIDEAGGDDGLGGPFVLSGVIEIRGERRSGLAVCGENEQEAEG